MKISNLIPGTLYRVCFSHPPSFYTIASPSLSMAWYQQGYSANMFPYFVTHQYALTYIMYFELTQRLQPDVGIGRGLP